jgi:hypothetical protein
MYTLTVAKAHLLAKGDVQKLRREGAEIS